jgi:hypothetical protein
MGLPVAGVIVQRWLDVVWPFITLLPVEGETVQTLEAVRDNVLVMRLPTAGPTVSVHEAMATPWFTPRIGRRPVAGVIVQRCVAVT